MTVSIATFGDSWPYGSELNPGEQPYGHLLAEMLGTVCANHSQPATSNEHMILQLEKHVSDGTATENSIAVFFITYPGRSCWIDYDGQAREVRPDLNGFINEKSLDYYYYKYFHTPQQERFRTHQTILSLQRMCDVLKLKDYYIVGWSSDVDFDWPGIDKTRIYNQGKTTCADLLGIDTFKFDAGLTLDNKFIFPNQLHPNQLGHQLIAKSLYTWIKDTIV